MEVVVLLEAAAGGAGAGVSGAAAAAGAGAGAAAFLGLEIMTTKKSLGLILQDSMVSVSFRIFPE